MVYGGFRHDRGCDLGRDFHLGAGLGRRRFLLLHADGRRFHRRAAGRRVPAHPTFYRLRVVSLYEYLDGRFGILSHHTGAWFFFVSKMLGAALRVYVVCAVMQLLVFSHYGLPFWLNALVTMLFVWLYTQQGGVKSLIWTDTLKTFCLVGSLVPVDRLHHAGARHVVRRNDPRGCPRRPIRGCFSSTIPPPTAISGRCSLRASCC